jgi:hypothetical protein
MLSWRWFNRSRHPLARLLFAVLGLVALAGVLTIGFFALVAFAVIGAIVALTRALARTHVAAAVGPQPRPASDHPRVIEGEFVVVDSQRSGAPR